MNANKLRSIKRLILLGDGVLIVLAMVISYLLQPWLRGFIPQLRSPVSMDHLLMIGYFALPLWLVLGRVMGLDRFIAEPRSPIALLGDVVKVSLAGMLGLTLLIYSINTVTINRSLMGLFVLTTAAVLFAERMALSWWYADQYRSGQSQQRYLVVGQISPTLTAIIQRAESEPRAPRFVGYLAPDPGHQESVADYVSGERPGTRAETSEGSGLFIVNLGRTAELDRVLHEQSVDRVLFFPPHNDLATLAPHLATCERLGIPASLVIDYEAHSLDPPRLDQLLGLPLVSFEHTPKDPGLLAIKHGFDVAAAAVALVLLAPVLLCAALAVLMTMGRPIFFAQERAGLFGRPFHMLKFRTMARDADERKQDVAHLNEQDGPVFKVRSDPRITPVGRLLRKMSIDELPQLFHVLRGRMSLVGPRPLPVAEQMQIVGWHRRRLSMKPGITGLWQVSGRSDIGFEQWMQLDLRYVDEWSPWLDVQILLRTVPAVLSGRGAH